MILPPTTTTTHSNPIILTTMSEQTTDLTIVRKENVQMIAQSAPQIYKDNTTSSKRCSEYGQKLLAQIKANGMNDELDTVSYTHLTLPTKRIV